MSLVVGELTAYLTVNKDDYRRGVAEARTELRDLAKDADRQATATDKRSGRMVSTVSNAMAQVGRDADRQGRDAGGKLSQGISQGIVRNSPLIVAAVGGALAAGGPVAMAGATALFAGVGIVAAAQSQKVQSAWVGTWDHIKSAAIEDAGVIEPALVRMAGQVGGAFDRLRPQIQGAFSAAAPQMQVFTDGVLDLAQNALPGLVRAVQAGMPVTQGLADFLAKVGSGLGEFFDRISAHGPAAGQVFSILGDSMAALLPTLGELLGQGAELAADVLPLLSGSLGLLLKVTEALGPALPAVAMGFSAFKIVQTLDGPLKTLAQNLAFASYNGTMFAGTAGKLSTAVSAVGAALPALTAVVVAFQAVQQQAEAPGQKWADALLKGGDAAATARAQMTDYNSAFEEANSGFGGFVAGLIGVSAQTYLTGEAIDQGNEKYKAMRAAMDPVQRAQLDLTNAIAEHGPKSDEAKSATERLTAAQEAQAAADAKLEMAIDGVTQAMVDQANQAMAAIDSGFAYRDAVNQLEDAQLALAEAQAHVNDTNKDTRTSAEDVQRAQLAVEEQSYRTAAAFGKQQADLSGLEEGTKGYNRVVQEQTLAALEELQRQAGPEMAAAIGQQIAMLQAGGVSLDSNSAQASNLAQKMRDLGLSVTQVPGEKYVQIDAPTADQQARLEALGYTVRTLPNGTVVVQAANVQNVENAINNVARSRTATVYLRQVGAQQASGGSVDDAARAIRAATGRVVGPGGPTDDMVPAIGPGGEPWRLSNHEWVINAAVSQREGDGPMAMLNAGLATIVPLRQGNRVRALAGGGSSATSSTATTTAGRVVTIQGDVVVKVETPLNLANDRDLRRAGEKIRTIIQTLDQEVS